MNENKKVVKMREAEVKEEVREDVPLELTREEFDDCYEQFERGKGIYGMTLDETKEYLDKQAEILNNLDGHPTRREIRDIMTQVIGNINQISEYLMQDVNAMYSNHVFPFQMRLSVLEDIVVGKGIATQEEITKLVEERVEKLKEQAKEIRDAESENTDSDEASVEK